MLFVSLPSPILPQVDADGYELRLDLFPRIDLKEIEELCAALQKPLIFTVRPSHLHILDKLLSLEPDFVDLEESTDLSCLQGTSTKLIKSLHDYEKTPGDLQGLLEKMMSPDVYAYKIATFAHSTSDALRMLLLMKQNPHLKISGICMGSYGTITRILSPVFGQFINYAAVSSEQATAPGQLTAHELTTTYHYDHLGSDTSVYGLIGHPIDASPGHIHHNEWSRDENFQNVYVKMNVETDQLFEFLNLAKELGFEGLSVTAPLKEAILPYLQEIDSDATKIGAVNTLVMSESKWIGRNTDSYGFLQALLEKVPSLKKQRIVVLGAGGAARAIAFEALRQEACVIVVNRTYLRGQEMATELGCEVCEQIPEDYDILINATSSEMPIDPAQMLDEKWVMDIHHNMTPFLQTASQKQCQIITGFRMWYHQAKAQRIFWMSLAKNSFKEHPSNF